MGLSEHLQTCPQHELDILPGTMVQGNHLVGLVLPTHSRSASQHKKASETICSSREEQAPAASRYFTAPTARILSNRSPQRLHAAALDALKLVPDQNPMEGKALAQAHVILAQLKFAEHYVRARCFQQAPPETERSIPGAGHHRRASPVDHNCSTASKALYFQQVSLETNSSAVATAMK